MKNVQTNHSELPLVTIAITCYNYGEFVGDAIESAIDQTYPNTRIHIYDDGSTDGSLEVINKFRNNTKIRIISRENKGIVFTRNQALEEAEGEFILFLDADNILTKDYLQKLYDTSLETSADITYADMQIISNTINQYQRMPEFDFGSLLVKNYIDVCSLIRISAVGDTRFSEEMEELTHEDWDFFIDLAARGCKFAHARNGAYIIYRLKSNSRNMSYDNDDSPFVKHQKWYKIIESIIQRQRVRNPEFFDNVFDAAILEHKAWYDEAAQTIEYQQQQLQIIEQQQREHQQQQLQQLQIIEQQKNHINEILASKTWKIGSAIMYLPKKLKRLF